MHGRVIGIHSAISRSVAENFHVAITEFYDTWKEMVNAPAIAKQALRAPRLCRRQGRG